MGENGGMNWSDFIDNVVHGTTTIIQSVKSPTGQTQTYRRDLGPVPGATASMPSWVGLAVIAVLFIVIVKG